MSITKDELRQYRFIAAEIKELKCEIAELECIATSPHVQEYGASPAGGGMAGDRQSVLVARLSDMKIQYMEKITRLLALKARIEEGILCLDDEKQRLVRLRYFRGLTWEAVAVEMGVTWRTVHNWHGDILRKLKKEPSGG